MCYILVAFLFYFFLETKKTTVTVGHLMLESDDSLNESTFAESAFLGGILACAKEDILFQQCGDNLCVIDWLFSHIARLCYGVQQYQAFQLLLQWYNKVSVYRSSSKCDALFKSTLTPVVKDTMTLVWTNLDSPVEGVNQLVIEIFSNLINCLKHSPDHGTSKDLSKDDHSSGDLDQRNDPCQDLVRDVLAQTSNMSWHVKGKHRITGAVISLVPIDEVSLSTKFILPFCEMLHLTYLCQIL